MGIVRIGIDDTDSKRGMCTTYLGAVVADRLRLQGHSLEGYPKLVRLNPNWHLKTRGNCAVSLDVMYVQSKLEDLKELVLNTVQELAELDCETTNPGVVLLMSGFEPLPVATIAASTSSTNSVPAMGIGFRLPDASGSPSSILTQVTLSRPSSLFTLVGAARNSISIPSSSSDTRARLGTPSAAKSRSM